MVSLVVSRQPTAERWFVSLLLLPKLMFILLSMSSRAFLFSSGMIPAIRTQRRFQQSSYILVRPVSMAKANDSEDDGQEGEDDLSEEVIQTSEVRIDDGGSNLTDRFKYKVNALMGVFDPADAANDNERENGNILNAMLRFPLEYTFHVVGKTDGSVDVQLEFVEQVKRIPKATTGADPVACEITPRGSKFTKVTILVQVESADAINSIYDQLRGLELSVMQF